MADGVSREVQISMAAASMFPGFRFSPTDDELVSFYLKNKLEGSEKSVQIIAEIEIYKYEPWDLPAKSVTQSDSEWFFFSPRGKKYPNGNQTRRTTELGYWKATGKERNVKSGSNVIGTKRTLVFHTGRAPKGERTDWIMHEYSMKDKSQDFLVVCRLRRNSEFRQHNSSSKFSPSRRHLSSEPKDKAADGFVKKCSYSSESPSGEHVDSTESNKKDAAEAALAESSDHHTDQGSDDFYTEILKDDIINLDESPPYAASNQPSLVWHRSDAEKIFQHDQGTANRRIRIKKKREGKFGDEKSDALKTSDSEKMVNKGRCSSLKLSRSWLVNTFSSVKGVRGPAKTAFVLLILFAFFLALFEVFGKPKDCKSLVQRMIMALN